MSWLIAILALLMPASALAQPQPSQPAIAPRPPAGTWVVATHVAPPFVMKSLDGTWSGLAIDLWRDIAKDRGIKFRFAETDLNGMVQGVASGKYAASVGALTVTPKRETAIDFTHPFYTTGFGIVVGKAPPSWLLLIYNLFTWQFLSAVLLLGAVLLVIGALFWAVERRANTDEFDRSWKGIGSGFWFSAVTMTTVGYGDKAPKTVAGKLIAVVWTFAAIIIISTFTGLIASSLTESRIGGAIKNPDDLKAAAVGSISGSASDDWLGENGIGFQAFPTVHAGLAAVASGKIDAFVYDRPLLRYVVRQKYSGKLRLLPGTFGRQDYAFALPQGSPRREEINRSLLRRIDSQEWTDLLRQTLGKDE
ncbi:MAG: transporter substrate-binding domain-containing protein [Sphingomonas sp.]